MPIDHVNAHATTTLYQSRTQQDVALAYRQTTHDLRAQETRRLADFGRRYRNASGTM